MFLTYLRRELTNRRKQTVIIAVGMALAIALVVIVSSIASGVKAAQSSVLQSVYGVGTDITITKTEQPTSSSTGRPSFDFGSRSGSDSGSTDLSQSRLAVARGSSTLNASNLATVTATTGVKAATGVLTLENTTFSGQVQQGSSSSDSSSSGGSASGSTDAGSSDSSTQQGPPSGGEGGGFGGGSFNVDSFTVTGIPVSGDAVGPLTSTEITKGRSFTAKDAGKDVVVLDSAYAKSEDKAVGDTLEIGGTKFTVIGIVASTGSSSTTGSNTYVPLDTAQSLADLDGKVTSIYVSAESSSDVSTIKSALQQKLSSATVSTEADLASSVSGSLSTASSLVSNLGTWLSIVVLAAAFLIAIFFTISGVTRRTREFGTLKAIGWSNGRITRQVAGESLVQGLIGGVIGAAAGLIGILVVNVIAPTISASASTSTRGGTGGGMPGGAATAAAGSGTTGGAPAGGFGGGAASTASTTDVVLHAPVTVEVILLAIGLAVLGGLLAGALGGWRASRLRPAEALRSVA
ncbi:ABC-type antimicrobial peptide transport system permease subunit [Curtobacterium luteum]|uniref:ABC-type antimicrobial peptide transport system permease subunit n=1 Tax=Curtobacterium luteum TaxID=33881 RepID=A0A8H9L120_9MICO|nr:FtsX-like permease family protein [Curtobacterium luteum]MBM7802184.1 ABC-type antimicrobial peptide transport system permease subunit [Curtobacterium luteum]NUU52290.1 FtsX-like permease family protein [Curtobacterium luteum]GGL03631.1 membrane protein [Curtobacterium luteum]